MDHKIIQQRDMLEPGSCREKLNDPVSYFVRGQPFSHRQLQTAADVLRESGVIPRSWSHSEVVELAFEVLQAAQMAT